jgi:hypothetical protein
MLGGAAGGMPVPGGCGTAVGGGCIIGVVPVGAGPSLEHAHSQTAENTAIEIRPDSPMIHPPANASTHHSNDRPNTPTVTPYLK